MDSGHDGGMVTMVDLFFIFDIQSKYRQHMFIIKANRCCLWETCWVKYGKYPYEAQAYYTGEDIKLFGPSLLWFSQGASWNCLLQTTFAFPSSPFSLLMKRMSQPRVLSMVEKVTNPTPQLAKKLRNRFHKHSGTSNVVSTNNLPLGVIWSACKQKQLTKW